MIKINSKDVVKIEKFPNGEKKVILLTDCFLDKEEVIINFKWESDEDLITLMLITKHLESNNIKPSLYIYYMPYSRMDRVHKASSEVFTLKYICDFINMLNFKKVYVNEPHSDVTTALLNNCSVIDTTLKLFEILVKAEHSRNNCVVCFPDAGAQKRYSDLEKEFDCIVGFKHRNWETGRIDKLELLGSDVKDKEVIIVDDLSSYGGTFVLTAKELKARGAKKISLVVSHAEKNILLGDVFKTDVIDKVYTTDSIISCEDVPENLKERLFVIKQ